MTDTPEPNSPEPKRFGPLKKLSLRFPRPLKIMLFAYLGALLIGTIMSFPALRAVFYPIASKTRPQCFTIRQFCPVYTTAEKPTFVVDVQGAINYEFKIYDISDVQKLVRGGSQTGYRYLNVEFDYAGLFDRQNHYRDLSAVQTLSGPVIAQDANEAQILLTVEDRLKPGDYIGVLGQPGQAQGGNNTGFATFTVTNLGAIVKQDPEKIVISTIDLMSRKPWPDADVSLLQFESALKILPAATTDKQGMVTIKRPAGVDDQSWAAVLVEARAGEHRAYFGPYTNCASYQCDRGYSNYFGGFDQFPNNRFRAFFETDRPIYRVGQTCNFKGTIRKVTAQGIKNPGVGLDLRFSIVDPAGNQVRSENARTDAAGTFSGHIAATESTKTGPYQVNITYPGEQMESFAIWVQQYRKPDFKVDVVPEKPRFVRGDRVRFKIQANYYFGAPLKDAKIKYRVSSLPDWNAKSRLETRDTGDSAFFAGWSSGSHFTSAGVPFDKEGELLTDADGQSILEFDVPTAKPTADSPYSNNYSDENFIVAIETTDLSRKTFSAEGMVPVTRGEFALLIDSPSSVVKAGEDISVRVKAIDYDKRPLRGQKVKLNLSRWTFERKLLESEFKRIDLASTEAATDETGSAVVTFKTDREFLTANYDITAESVDSKFRTVGDITSVLVFGDKQDGYLSERAENERFSLTLDKDVYKPGDTARAVIYAPIKPGEEVYVLATIEGAYLRQYKQIRMTEPAALVEFAVDASYMPNAYVGAALVLDRHKPYSLTEALNVSPANNFVSVALTTDKPQYNPGETVKYTVTARKKDGSPAANMHVCAAVVDEGIFAVRDSLARAGQIYDQGAGNIFQSLYRRIGNEVSTRFTFTQNYTRELNKRPVFDGAGLVIVHSPLIALFRGYWMNTGMDDQICADGIALSTSAVPAPAAAPGRAMPSEAMAESDDVARGAPSSKRLPAGPAARVRSNFADAAAWYPSLVTGPAGTATFSVKLPDDLTTWRATVNGVTTGAEIGSATRQTVSTQDFLARLTLPRFYTEHDETVVTGLIHNLSQGEQSVALTLAVSPNIKLAGSPTVSIKMKKDEIKRQNWKIRVLSAGEAKITLKAVGSTLSDAEERKVPVRTFGYRVFFAKNGVIKDADAEKVFPVKLPTDAKLSTGSFEFAASSSAIGPVLGSFETLIDYPYGCTEQTLSKLIPSVVAIRLSRNLAVPISSEMQLKFNDAFKLAMPKLAEYQHGDGGWGWWATDKSDPYMTAHVLEGFYLLKQAGMRVDEGRIEQGRSYLLSKIQALSANPWGRFDSENQAKAVYVMSLFGDSLDPVTRTWQLINLKKMTPEALAYMTMAFKNVKDDKAADRTYARLKELRNDSLDYSNWDHTTELLVKLGVETGWDYTYRFTGVETTALALRATVMMEPDNEDLLERISRWLVIERDENGWSNTKTTSAVYLALLEKELSQSPNRMTDFRARVDVFNRLFRELQFKKTFERGEQLVSVPLSPAPDAVKIRKSGPGWLYYNTLLSYDRPLKPGEQPVLKSLPADLKIKREMFRLLPEKLPRFKETTYRKEPLGKTPVKSGDMIMMKVTVSSPIAVPYAMVEAALPCGGEVMLTPPRLTPEKVDERGPDPNEEVAANRYWWTHQDVLDDRIAFFASEMPAGKCEFHTFIRMEMPGRFNVNPVNMEAMYTNKVHGRSTAEQITVVE